MAELHCKFCLERDRICAFFPAAEHDNKFASAKCNLNIFNFGEHCCTKKAFGDNLLRKKLIIDAS